MQADRLRQDPCRRAAPASTPWSLRGGRMSSPWKCRATLSRRRREQRPQLRDARIAVLLREALQLAEEKQKWWTAAASYWPRWLLARAGQVLEWTSSRTCCRGFAWPCWSVRSARWPSMWPRGQPPRRYCAGAPDAESPRAGGLVELTPDVSRLRAALGFLHLSTRAPELRLLHEIR